MAKEKTNDSKITPTMIGKFINDTTNSKRLKTIFKNVVFQKIELLEEILKEVKVDKLEDRKIEIQKQKDDLKIQYEKKMQELKKMEEELVLEDQSE